MASRFALSRCAAAMLGAVSLLAVGSAARAAGNPAGHCVVPPEAQLENTSNPDTVVGNGTPARGTGAAVAQGGVITFDCGAAPVTITLSQTAKIVNDTGPRIVIDGGGKGTLSGVGQVRILYMNTCDPAQVWTTPHCNDQDHPQLTVQNLRFADGDARGENPDGGGAIFVRGGRFKVVNSSFVRNECDDVGPDVGGGAIRVFDQSQDLPVYVTSSTFGGGVGLGNVCSNGGGLSSIGVSYTVLNTLLTHNRAIGNGANPAQSGTPGGGSGGAIFFVSNDASGDLVIEDSVLAANPSLGFETQGLPSIFLLGDANPVITNSILSVPESDAAASAIVALLSLAVRARPTRRVPACCDDSPRSVPGNETRDRHGPAKRIDRDSHGAQ